MQQTLTRQWPGALKPKIYSLVKGNRTIVSDDVQLFVRVKRNVEKCQSGVLNLAFFYLTYLQEKEMQNGGATPRMLCLDDYFSVEVEKMETDPETKAKKKVKVSASSIVN